MNILNFDFLHSILKSDNVEHKRILYFSLINSLKGNYTLYQYIDMEYIENILNHIELIEDIYESADIILFVLDVIYENEFKINDKQIQNLFYLYLKNLNNGYYVQSEIINTFHLFLDLGIQANTIITECMKLYDIDDCIHLFSKLSFNSKEIDKKMNYLIQQHKKLMIRFDLVLHFYLMTSFDYVQNILIAGDYLKKYHYYRTICADWAFSDEYNDDSFVQQNIITQKELDLFIELGNIYNQCKKIEYNTDTEEDLFKYLDIVCNKFKLLLKSDEIKSIRKRFMKEKDLFEVALCLPEQDTIK